MFVVAMFQIFLLLIADYFTDYFTEIDTWWPRLKIKSMIPLFCIFFDDSHWADWCLCLKTSENKLRKSFPILKICFLNHYWRVWKFSGINIDPNLISCMKGWTPKKKNIGNFFYENQRPDWIYIWISVKF